MLWFKINHVSKIGPGENITVNIYNQAAGKGSWREVYINYECDLNPSPTTNQESHRLFDERKFQRGQLNLVLPMGLLPDTQNCGLCMRRECRERFPRHRLQRKPLVSDPGMHHGTCVTHVPWCMSGSLTHGGGENVPGIPSACATRDLTYLWRGP